MKALTVITIATLAATSALAAEPGPFADKRSIACEPPTTPVCVIDPNIPPNPMLPGNNMVCTCAPAHPVMSCQVSIIYPQNDPTNTRMLPMGPWCDAAGMRLATAVALARMLGAP